MKKTIDKHRTTVEWGSITKLISGSLFSSPLLFYCYHMCMNVLPVRLCTICMQCLQGYKKVSGLPETVVIDDCKLPCRCWNSNHGPLEKPPVPLTADTSSLQSHWSSLLSPWEECGKLCFWDEIPKGRHCWFTFTHKKEEGFMHLEHWICF